MPFVPGWPPQFPDLLARRQRILFGGETTPPNTPPHAPAPGIDKAIAIDPPGTIGLVDDDAIVLLRLNESTAAQHPADSAGNLNDFGITAPLTTPTVVNGVTGLARHFNAGVTSGMVAQDRVAGTTLATRDLTVQAIARWVAADQVSYGTPGKLVTRGLGFSSSAAETRTFALCFSWLSSSFIPLPAGQGRIFFEWEEVGGGGFQDVGAIFTSPIGFTLFTATRRWISPTSVLMRYYIGDTLLGESISVHGNIGGGTTGTTQIGSAWQGGFFVFGSTFTGDIDELMILDREITREEIEATWLRITRYQPYGVQLFTELHDPGFPLPNDPALDVSLETRMIGTTLGYAAAQAENMRANMLPRRAYGSVLEDWEEVVQPTPGAVLDVDTRRSRVIAKIQQRGGSSPDGLRNSLEHVIGGAPASALEFLAYSSTIRSTFTAGINRLLWDITDITGSGPVTAISGAASFQPGAGTFLMTGVTRTWTTMRQVSGGNSRQAHQLAKLAWTTPVDTAEAGIYFENAGTLDYLLLGLRDVAGSFKVYTESFVSGVSQGATIQATLGANPAAIWLHLYQTTTDGVWQAAWSTTNGSAGFTLSGNITHPTVAHWAGCYLRSTGAIAAPRADFDDHVLRAPSSSRPFNAYALLDRALGFTPDIDGAQSVISVIKHAFVHGAFVTSREFILDDPDSRLDFSPFGGDAAPPPSRLLVSIGPADSNGVGIGDSDKLFDPALKDPYTPVPYDRKHALGLTDPPAWVTLAPGVVRPYAPGGGSGMGLELTLARTLHEAGADVVLATRAISGTTLADWLPTATFPAINLWTIWVADMHALEASHGIPLGLIVPSLGTNDATDAGLAAAFQANMTTILSAMRAEFPSALIVWPKTNSNGTQANRATVIAAQVAVAAADTKLVLVETNRHPLPDGFHFESDGYASLGQQIGFAALDRLGFERRTVTAPTVVGWGATAHGSGVLAPVMWPGALNGDIGILPVVTGLQDKAITTPSGWTLIPNTDVTSTQGGTNKQRMAVFWRPVAIGADGLDAAISVTSAGGPNQFNAAQPFAIRAQNANPVVDTAGGTVNNGFDTGPTSVPGLVTAVANELVMRFVGGYSGGANVQTLVDAGLSGFAKHQDQPYIIGSDRQALGEWDGIKDDAGTLAAASATSSANLIRVAATVAVKST